MERLVKFLLKYNKDYPMVAPKSKYDRNGCNKNKEPFGCLNPEDSSPTHPPSSVKRVGGQNYK